MMPETVSQLAAHQLAGGSGAEQGHSACPDGSDSSLKLGSRNLA